MDFAMLKNLTVGYNLLAEGGDDDRKRSAGLSGFLKNVTTRKPGKKYTYKIHDGEYSVCFFCRRAKKGTYCV